MSVLALSCLQIPNSPIKMGLLTVVVSALIISLSKLETFYNIETSKLKDFGTGPGETLFPAWLAMLSAGYIIYVMSASISAFKGCGSK